MIVIVASCLFENNIIVYRQLMLILLGVGGNVEAHFESINAIRDASNAVGEITSNYSKSLHSARILGPLLHLSYSRHLASDAD